METAQNSLNPVEEEHRQYQLYLKNLPTVNYLTYNYMILETVPMCISLELEKQKITNDSDESSSFCIDTKYKSHHMLYRYIKLSPQQQENILKRVKSIGFDLGSKLTDMLVFTKDPNFRFEHNSNGVSQVSSSNVGTFTTNKRVNTDLLSIMKFICRDVWKLLFNKQVDNLKTNHKGTFYLLDKNFEYFKNFAVEPFSKYYSNELDNTTVLIQPYLEICTGLIKGVLSTLNISGVADKDEIICSYEFPKDMPVGTVSFSVFVPINH
ncbi:hypothetical protein ACO0RG_001080 [Hanseniaspora osmophila]